MDAQAAPTGEARVIPLDEFVSGLKNLTEGLITKAALCDYLTRFEPERGDLQPYVNWNPDRHTRNLIFRTPLIEVMLICWNVGNVTPLHTHNGQLGWMVMVEGKLKVENYRLVRCNKPENQEVVGIDCLAGATDIEMKLLGTETCEPGGPLNTVDKHQTIHRIQNPAEWSTPAMSIHIYSLPIASCVVFDMENRRCFRRDLGYDNE